MSDSFKFQNSSTSYKLQITITEQVLTKRLPQNLVDCTKKHVLIGIRSNI